jgi:hypothetical protein
MKSIKEKAEEYENDFDVCHFGSHDMIKSYEAGANYVLDIIQRFVIEEHFNLEHIVKQLKSNQ